MLPIGLQTMYRDRAVTLIQNLIMAHFVQIYSLGNILQFVSLICQLQLQFTVTNECHYIIMGLFFEKPAIIHLQVCIYDDGNPAKMAENIVINTLTIYIFIITCPAYGDHTIGLNCACIERCWTMVNKNIKQAKTHRKYKHTIIQIL